LPNTVRRGARGIRSSDRPANLKNAFVTNRGIFQRLRGGGVRLAYALKPSVTLHPDVPFVETFEDVIRREMGRPSPLGKRWLPPDL